MANRDLLKEAIADAKAVKEVAIANAKAALEEAFTPHLKDMLAQKINEMEDLEETDLAEVDKEKKMEEEMEMKKEGYGKQDEAKKEVKEEELEEELDLEEILAELELEEGEELEEADKTYEGEEVKEGEDPMEEGAQTEMEEGEDPMEEADLTYEAEEEEINLEDMSEEDLKGFIEEIIEDMIEDGELVPGPNADESEAEEEEGAEAEGEVGDADVDVDVDLQEGEEPMEEAMMSVDDLVAAFKALGSGAKKAFMKALMFAPLPNTGMGYYGEGKEEVGEELKEANEVINQLRSDLNEVNLLNSKLLYTNKIFRNKNLTENQKIKVLKAFDKAETVKQAKTIYETLNENLVAKTKKSNIRESLGAASKPAGVAPKRNLNEGIVQEDAMVSRFKKLAGIN